MDQTITCIVCGAEFSTEEELRKHNVEVHGEQDDKMGEETKLTCPACGMPFATPQQRDKHIHETHGVK
jgi:uncharacterized C2H2 Zn-finger protein